MEQGRRIGYFQLPDAVQDAQSGERKQINRVFGRFASRFAGGGCAASESSLALDLFYMPRDAQNREQRGHIIPYQAEQ